MRPPEEWSRERPHSTSEHDRDQVDTLASTEHLVSGNNAGISMSPTVGQETVQGHRIDADTSKVDEEPNSTTRRVPTNEAVKFQARLRSVVTVKSWAVYTKTLHLLRDGKCAGG
jgi:hypothetical protein